MKSWEKTKRKSVVLRGKYAAKSTLTEQELRKRIAEKAYLDPPALTGEHWVSLELNILE